MNLYLITYKLKEESKDGVCLIKGKSWDDIYTKLKSEYNDKITLTGIQKCDKPNNDVFQILFDFKMVNRYV